MCRILIRALIRTSGIPAFLLMWGVLVNSSCTGFALKPHPISGTNSRRRRPNVNALSLLIFPRSARVPSVQVRGGAIDSKRLRSGDDDKNNEQQSALSAQEPPPISPQEARRRKGMGAALAATYFTVMASKCALPAVLSQLTSPEIGLKFVRASSTGASSTALISAHTPQILMARLLTVSTIAIAAGKIFLGPVIDHFGGVFSLKVALSLLALLLGIISSSDSFRVFAVSWVVVDFIFSSCWAACINAIHQNFPESEWTQRIGLLAAAARTGNAAAFCFFAFLLGVVSPIMAQPWKVVFAASAAIQIVPIALLTYFGREKGDITTSTTLQHQSTPKPSKQNKKLPLIEESPPQVSTPLKTLRREAKTPVFWLHLISRSVLMVFASFLLFVPLLLNQAFGASASTAAQVGSLYALGCLLSVSLGANLYARLQTKQQKASIIALLLGLSTLASAAQWGHMAGVWTLSVSASAASMFLWGFSFAIPFYIPPSLYALARGGVESSATIADVFDIGGFGLLALFNGYVAGIQHAKIAAWIPTFGLTTGCSAIAMICLVLATLLD